MTRPLQSLPMIFVFTLLLADAASASSIRGMVAGTIGAARVGRAGVSVTLAARGSGGLVTVKQTVTDGGGFYYFLDVAPGGYAVLVGSAQYPVQVQNVPSQDIPPIIVP